MKVMSLLLVPGFLCPGAWPPAPSAAESAAGLFPPSSHGGWSVPSWRSRLFPRPPSWTPLLWERELFLSPGISFSWRSSTLFQVSFCLDQQGRGFYMKSVFSCWEDLYVSPLQFFLNLMQLPIQVWPGLYTLIQMFLCCRWRESSLPSLSLVSFYRWFFRCSLCHLPRLSLFFCSCWSRFLFPQLFFSLFSIVSPLLVFCSPNKSTMELALKLHWHDCLC